ncbi:MAG: nucleotidyltransferase domain-containing protein [Synergistaceae bacterium]|nr:nucleotidyltransferase domain-containing protein [Synergistaceae bacterium]
MKKEVDLKRIVDSICQFSQSLFAAKLYKVILYGSYAKGDFDEESDVDVMIVVDMNEANLRHYETSFTEFSSDASLENEVLIVPLLCDKARFEAQIGYVPFMRNVNEEGKVIYA